MDHKTMSEPTPLPLLTLLLTSLWLSTCTSRKPWNSRNGLPLQPKLQSLSIAHPKGSHLQQARMLHSSPGHKIHLAWRKGAWPFLDPCPPPLICFWVMPNWNALPMSQRLVIHSPSPPYQNLQVQAAPLQSPATSLSHASPSDFPKEVFQPQREMNMALEQLLATRATLDLCRRELVQNFDIVMQQHKTQATTWAHALEQSHGESMLNFEHETLVEEGCTCQACIEAYGAALWTCPVEAHGVQLYPLQLLIVNVQPAGLLPTASQLSPVEPSGGKCQWQPSKQSLPTPKVPPAEDEEAIKECPYKRLRPLKEGQQEAFSKEFSLVRVARQTYWESHPIDFRQEGSHDLSSVLHEMVSSTCLLDSSIFEVQDTWCRKERPEGCQPGGKELT